MKSVHVLASWSIRRMLSPACSALRLGVSACVLMFVVAAFGAAADEGLAAHWTFDEGEGTVLHDSSGNNNHGTIHGAKWVKAGNGYALQFDGEDDHVDCGDGAALDLRDQLSIVLWVRPDNHGGEPGIVGKAYSSFVITQFHQQAWSYISDTDSTGGGHFQIPLTMRKWQHLALTYDGKMLRCYLNGRLGAEKTVRAKITSGGHFWMGRSDGSVTYTKNAHFHGRIAEVKVYNRALMPAEIVDHVRATAENKGLNIARQIGIRTQPYPRLGKIRLTLDARALRPLPKGTRLRADLCLSGSAKPITRLETAEVGDAGVSELLFEARELAAGDYVIRASAAGPDGARIGEEASTKLEWIGQTEEYKNVRVLNNVCWELLNVDGMAVSRGRHVFANPYDRWVYIQTTADTRDDGKLRISLDSDSPRQAVIVHSTGGQSRREAMRFLKAGKHTLHVSREGNVRLLRIVVRAIPMLQYAFYGGNPCISPFGPYDWKFLSKDVLPNINVMISPKGKPAPAELKAWTDSGRHWISIIGNPGLSRPGIGVDQLYNHWSSAMGLKHPLMDGIIVDEFGGGDAPIYDVYRKAVEMIYATAKFKGKAFMPYGATFYGEDRSREFARTCIDGGGYIAWERYLPEQPTEKRAQAVINRNLGDKMFNWEQALPGSTRRMVMVLALGSTPNESQNVNPSVDFRVFMDMQIRHLATHPAFFGLGGIQEYFTYGADEESLRLTGYLYRHYCIDGNTEPLIKDPYRLSHIRNPDFAKLFEGWSVLPADEGSIEIRKHAGYSWLQGRYPRTNMGDTFLWMKRSAKKPNVFSQEIKNLTPGRLYSIKMITGDYRDLVAQRSKGKIHKGISVKLGNVEMLSGPKKSFQTSFVNWGGFHDLGKFNKTHRYCMNYHWHVFRAKDKTAKLTVTDWMSDTQPGGPIGQELMYNFIEVQPYLGK